MAAIPFELVPVKGDFSHRPAAQREAPGHPPAPSTADRLAGMMDIRNGALCWNQYTEWAALLEAGIRADRLGCDTLWTWDHL